MKRLLFIFCFLLMLPFTQAQNNDKYPEDKTTQALDNKAFEKTVEAYRVTVVSGTSDTSFYSQSFTTTTTRDSLLFGFTADRIQVLNDGTSSDTLYIYTPGTNSYLTTNTTLVKLYGQESVELSWRRSSICIKGNFTPTAGIPYRILTIK